ncbi:hypothetical protein VH441_07735 [Psychrobacter sp. HD31]|uniref:REP-associated tyrosine transposase n=1 Tax=Psychrobacter sp. HD31 TaxID=3112003 RepID=UPI003DA5BE63
MGAITRPPTLYLGNNTNYSQCWSQIKRRTTKLCPQYHLPIEELSYSKVKRNEKGIFQRRFYEHLIKDAADFRKHIDYLHYNPVKHGLVTHVRDWQYSSFHRYVNKGVYTSDWGQGVIFDNSMSDKLE